MENDKRKHWYCFSFNGADTDGNGNCTASTYSGYDNKYVDLAIIKENKIYAGLTEKAVLIAVSYLGHLTKQEFDNA